MGCGVSKEDIAEPLRVHTVVVNVGSPESHLKAHEVTLKQNHGLISLVSSPCNGPDSEDNNNSDLSNSFLHTSTLALRDGLQLPVESPQIEEDVPGEEQHEILPRQASTKELLCDETPQAQHLVQESPLFRCTNGLVGTLAGLDEILGTQEASSLKLAIKVTAEKIMSYGGVLHSLEDQVGDFSYPVESKGETIIECDHEAKEELEVGPEVGPEVLGSIIETFDKADSPALARSPQQPSLEGFRKKLPPILSPPNLSVIDNISTIDPFAKTQFRQVCQLRLLEIQDLTDNSQPSSPQLPHTTEMVALDNIKDIMVMDGALCSCGETQDSQSMAQLEDTHCDGDNNILSETLEAQETAGQSSGLNNKDQSFDNIVVCSLLQDSCKSSGENTINPLRLFSTCCSRIEYLEEDDIKPLTSDEFYT